MANLSRLARRLATLFGRGRFRSDLDEEMAFHREQAETELVGRGMAPDDAHAAAVRRFGNATRLRERAHETISFASEHFWQDMRYAIRQILRAPGFAASVIGTLTLGIGATTAIFTLINATLLRRFPYPEADRLVRIHDVRLQGRSTGGLVAVPRFFDLSARSKSFAGTGFFYFDDTTLISGTQLPVSIRGAGTNAGFWKVFGVPAMLGRTYDERDDRPNAPPVTVLSYEIWRQAFGGDPGVVGRQVTIEQQSTTIIGVMPQEFSVPAGIDLWRPAQFTSGDWKYRGNGSRFINVVARLAPGVSIDAARSDLRRLGEQLRSEHAGTDGLWQFDAQSMRDEVYGDLRPALLVLLAASGFLLLVACMNVANLLLTRATSREREMALRRALGASERRIQLQFLTESALLALLGGAAGLAATFALVRTAAAKIPGRLGSPGAIAMHWPVVWFAFALAVTCGIGFGIAPALRCRRGALNASLKQGDRHLGGASRGWARSAFISAQVGISLVLLVGASLLGESLWNLLKSPLGFVPEHVLTFRIVLPWNAAAMAIRDFYANVQSRIRALPGVIAVGQVSALPTEDWHSRASYDADWLPRTAHHDAVNAEVRSISGDYLRALGTPLLAGRKLTVADAAAKNNPVLVNRTFAQQYLFGRSPVGKHISDETGSMEIVGVIGDVRGTAGSIASKVGPEIYFSADGDHPNMRRSFLVRSQLPPEQLIPSIRAAVHEVDPVQAIANVSTMDELLDKSVAQPRLNMVLMAAFAAIALLLACVGIYGVVAWSVAQRVREIGVRMALGASRRQVSYLFLGRAMQAAQAGIVAGTCAALLLSRLLRSQLYGVAPNSPWIYAVAIPLLLIPVLAATLRPALRAASINPVDALRTE